MRSSTPSCGGGTEGESEVSERYQGANAQTQPHERVSKGRSGERRCRTQASPYVTLPLPLRPARARLVPAEEEERRRQERSAFRLRAAGEDPGGPRRVDQVLLCGRKGVKGPGRRSVHDEDGCPVSFSVPSKSTSGKRKRKMPARGAGGGGT